MASTASAVAFSPKLLFITGAVGVSSLVFDGLGQCLKTKMNARQRRAWSTANTYHLSHTIALAAIAWMVKVASPTSEGGVLPNAIAESYLTKAFYLSLAGALGFGSSIYTLAMGICPKVAGPVTPTSGLILTLGWLNVALAGLYW